jgi:ectoine hydrolase
VTLSRATFSAEEYVRRLARTQEALGARDFDLLLVTEPAHLNYLTGYDCFSFYNPQALVVPAAGELLLFVREIDAPGVVLTTRLDADQVVGWPERYVQRPDCHPMDWIAATMRERGLASGTVAIETESNAYSVRAHEALLAGLPGVETVDAEKLVNWVRTVKSDAEIDKMRVAGKIAERVMTKALDVIEPGVRQCDVVAAIYSAGITGLENAGGDYPAIPPLLPTGPAMGVPHLTWSDAPFNAGEATALELAGCHQRYHAPLARTLFLGEPPSLLCETAKIVAEGMDAALAAVRPGARCEDVDAAWRQVIARHGLSKPGRIGYPIGLGYPPDWGEQTMSLRPGDTTALEPNMTFHMILGIWMDGWGYELSESFVVTDGGAECLSRLPRGLTIKR